MIDPKEIKQEDLPLIVLSDKTSGVFSSFIKIWTKGYYNHIMWLHQEGLLASQGNTYSEVGLDRYMGPGMRLKFWKVKELTAVQGRLILTSIKQKLALPWYKKLYDWVGIIGQTIKIKVLSTPGLDYCSEDVPEHLKKLIPYLGDENLKKVLINLPTHGSPADLNRYFKENEEHFEMYGKWDSDED